MFSSLITNLRPRDLQKLTFPKRRNPSIGLISLWVQVDATLHLHSILKSPTFAVISTLEMTNPSATHSIRIKIRQKQQ
jgi:hypothetical protein